MAHGHYVCPTCRTVSLTHLCEHEIIAVSHKWRAPRKDNDRAWKRVAAGDLLWDHRAVEKSLRRHREKIDQVRERMRLKKRTTVRR